MAPNDLHCIFSRHHPTLGKFYHPSVPKGRKRKVHVVIKANEVVPLALLEGALRATIGSLGTSSQNQHGCEKQYVFQLGACLPKMLKHPHPAMRPLPAVLNVCETLQSQGHVGGSSAYVSATGYRSVGKRKGSVGRDHKGDHKGGEEDTHQREEGHLEDAVTKKRRGDADASQGRGPCAAPVGVTNSCTAEQEQEQESVVDWAREVQPLIKHAGEQQPNERAAEARGDTTLVLRQACLAPWRLKGVGEGVPSWQVGRDSANTPKSLLNEYLCKMKMDVHWKINFDGDEQNVANRVTASVMYGNVCLGSARARNKKVSQQAAALHALQFMKQEQDASMVLEDGHRC